MEGQIVDVPLTATNQLPPVPGTGPQGRLTQLVNGKVTRYTAGKDVNGVDITRLKVDKRDGFSTLSQTFFAVQAGATLPSSSASATLLADVGGDPLAIVGSVPMEYIPAKAAWGVSNYQIISRRLQESVLHSAASVSHAPDHAHLNARTMTVFIEATSYQGKSGGTNISNTDTFGLYMVTDDNGQTIKALTRVENFVASHQLKVFSDGTYFWIISDDGAAGDMQANVYDQDGTYKCTLSWTPAAPPFGTPLVWDATYFPGVGIVVAYYNGGTNLYVMRKLTTNGSTVTSSTANIARAGISYNMPIAFLRSQVTTRIYAAVATEIGGGSTLTVDAYDSTFSGTHTFAVATYNSTTGYRIGSLTGYTTTTAVNSDVVVAYSALATSATLADPADSRYAGLGVLFGTMPGFQQCDDLTLLYSVTFGGSSTLVRTCNGAVVSVQAFAIDGLWYCGLYAPDPTGNYPANLILPLSGRPAMAGTFDTGAAYANDLLYYTTNNGAGPPTQNRFHIPSTFVDDAGRVRFPLSFRAENINRQLTLGTADISWRARVSLSTIGIKTWSISPATIDTLPANGNTLIGGLQGTLWSSAPTEAGFPVAPYVPNVDTNASGSLTGTYEYILTFEWFDALGNSWKSPPSQAVTTTVSGKQVLVQGRVFNLSNKTGTQIRVGVYRNTFIAGIASTVHYKVFDDLLPLVDNPGAGTPINFEIWDNTPDSAIAINDVLYTDEGELSRYPMPPGHSLCTWQDRPCVIGPDGSVWVGAEFNDGDGQWWNPALRILIPTNDTPTFIRTMDEHLVIGCASSLWYCPRTTLPDSTGQNGTMPTPIPLPFTNGGTGAALSTREGVIYASSAGGIWQVTRGFTNAWIGQSYQDDLTGAITSIFADKNQNVFVLTATGIKVFDLLSGVWGKYNPPGSSCTAIGTVGGVLYFSDATATWKQVAGQTFDLVTDSSTRLYVAQSATIAAIRLNAIRNYKRVWGIQVAGVTQSICTCTVAMTYPDGDAAEQDFVLPQDPTSAAKTFPLELRATRQQTAALAFTITETQSDNTVFGAGYSLTALSFYVGLEKGFAKLPATKRYPAL